jgi:type III secretory pathway component EscT
MTGNLFAKGLVVGLVFAVPFWALIGWAVWP